MRFGDPLYLAGTNDCDFMSFVKPHPFHFFRDSRILLRSKSIGEGGNCTLSKIAARSRGAGNSDRTKCKKGVYQKE